MFEVAGYHAVICDAFILKYISEWNYIPVFPTHKIWTRQTNGALH